MALVKELEFALDVSRTDGFLDRLVYRGTAGSHLHSRIQLANRERGTTLSNCKNTIYPNPLEEPSLVHMCVSCQRPPLFHRSKDVVPHSSQSSL